VTRVKVRIGVLHRVVDEAFQQAFAHVASGTEVEHASLELVMIPARGVCRVCQVAIESTDDLVVCPQCEGVDLEFTAGDELILASLEYEPAAVRPGAKE
jgi:hydrogenase nickel incorporation protein HypA/HybF